MVTARLSLGWLVLFYSIHVTNSWIIGQEVSTTSGPVVGHASRSKREVSEYLGIRFAESTGGSNRFMRPKRYSGTSKIVASRYVSDVVAY
jgi:hypothetical protein